MGTFPCEACGSCAGRTKLSEFEGVDQGIYMIQLSILQAGQIVKNTVQKHKTITNLEEDELSWVGDS